MKTKPVNTWQELHAWKIRMQQPPTLLNRLTKSTQRGINRIIPEKVHAVITTAIKQMTRAVIYGAQKTTFTPRATQSLEDLEGEVLKTIKIYRSTAAVEGGATGFGGFISGFADLPLWLTIKLKMLFSIASQYGFDTRDYKERIYLLYIFQLTFSSQKFRNETFQRMANWPTYQDQLPDDIHHFDWRTFQLEYRDHIDLAKLLQLIPGIGALVGIYVNFRLTNKLGTYAMNAYRMRWEMLIKKSSNKAELKA